VMGQWMGDVRCVMDHEPRYIETSSTTYMYIISPNRAKEMSSYNMFCRSRRASCWVMEEGGGRRDQGKAQGKGNVEVEV
jgi:hypothetical protein